MPIGIYVDVHIPRQIVAGLKLRGIDVITAQEDGMEEAEDAALLDRSTELGRIIFTHDNDFLKEAADRFRNNGRFGGIAFAHQLNAPVGRCVDDLELIARTFNLADLDNRIEFIPY